MPDPAHAPSTSPRALVVHEEADIRSLLLGPTGSAGAGARDTPTETIGEAPPVFGALVIDMPARGVTLDGRPVELTTTEFDLLIFQVRDLASPFRAPRRSSGCGATVTGPATSTSSTSTSATCAASSEITRAMRRYVGTLSGVGYRMGEK